MKSRMQTALQQALTLVRKSQVLDATELIRSALSDAQGVPEQPRSSSNPRPLSLGSPQSPPLTPQLLLKERKPVLKRHLSANDPNPIKQPKPSGSFTSRTFSHQVRELSYMLYVPSQSSEHERSLVLMLHGCTQTPIDFALGTAMNSLADEFNLVVAYPLQPHAANSSGCWNWFDVRHQKAGSGEPAMLSSLAENLMREFTIDECRVFAAGLSAGGAMAEILASEYPRQFSAIGVHSGLPRGAATSLGNAFAAMNGSSKLKPPSGSHSAYCSRRIVFHGSDDKTVHPSNADTIVHQAGRRSKKIKKVEFKSVINGREVIRTIYREGSEPVTVEHWIILGGGHAWFGGDGRGSYTDPKGPDASREMVRFFLKL